MASGAHHRVRGDYDRVWHVIKARSINLELVYGFVQLVHQLAALVPLKAMKANRHHGFSVVNRGTRSMTFSVRRRSIAGPSMVSAAT